MSNGILRPTTGVIPPEAANLGIGEPGFPTPQVLIDAFRNSSLFKSPGYGDFHGSEELRDLVAQITSTPEIKTSAEDVLITNGATSGITAAILAIVSPGDEVIIPEPTYSLYSYIVRLAGGVPVYVPLTPDFQLDLEQIKARAQNARMVILCNPGNPTGVVLSAESLKLLGEMLSGTSTLVLADEAYAAFDYDHIFVSALNIPQLQGRLVYCQTLSKTYSMTGWRIGYLTAPAGVIPWIRQVHRDMVASVNRAAQTAAITALRAGVDLVREQLDVFDLRRRMMCDGLRSIPNISFTAPTGAFYIFIKYETEIPSKTLAHTLRERGVIVRPGIEFGPSGEHHFRVAYATDEQTISAGLDRIQSTLTLL